jgi:4-cresol dehydrogenase (hydroxylating)
MERLRQDLRIGAWNGSGALYGTRNQVKEARRLLRAALRGKASNLQFLDDRKLEMASRFAGVYQLLTGWNLKRTLAVLRPVYGLMKGIPTGQPLASTYWRKRNAPPREMHPDRDGCGLIWCSPVAPNDGRHAARITGIATELVLHHGFEPAISMTVLTDRSLSCIISLSYDRAIPGEDEKAGACSAALLNALAREGYHPYRLSIGSMEAMDGDVAYRDVLRSIKNSLDPNGVLSPGRYVPFSPAHSQAGAVPRDAADSCR